MGRVLHRQDSESIRVSNAIGDDPPYPITQAPRASACHWVSLHQQWLAQLVTRCCPDLYTNLKSVCGYPIVVYSNALSQKQRIWKYTWVWAPVRRFLKKYESNYPTCRWYHELSCSIIRIVYHWLNVPHLHSSQRLPRQ